MSDDIRRNLRIGVQVDGTEQGNRKLGQTAGQLDQVTTSTDKASESSSRFAETMLKRSAAIDKNLQRGEELFKGSDRLLSIMGKLTGAIGLGTLAYKAGSAAIDFFTGKQKKAELAAKATTKAIEEQARKIAEFARFRSAGDKFAASIGVDIEEIDTTDLLRGKALTEATERARENVARAADRAMEMAREIEKFDNAGKLAKAQGLVDAGVGGAARRWRDQLRAQRAALKAAADEAVADQERLRVKALEAGNALFNFKGDLITAGAYASDDDIDLTGGVAAGGGGGGAPKPKAAPEDIRKIIGEVDALIAKSERLRQISADAAAYALPFDAVAIEQITTALDPLEAKLRGLGEVFGGLGAFVQDAAGDFRDMVIEGRALGTELASIEAFGYAAAEGFAAAAVDAIWFGGSVDKAIAASAKRASAEAAMGFLESSARGTTALFTNPAAAPGHFKAAGLWLALSAVAGGLGAAVGGGGGGGGRTALPPPTRRDLPEDRGERGGTTINVTLDLKARPYASAQDVDDAVLAGATRALRRSGSSGRAAFMRATR